MSTANADNMGWVIGLISLSLFVVVGIFYCVAQHRTLTAIQRRNRRIPPGLVWLQFVPLLGQIWQIFVIIFIADSCRAEIESHREDNFLGIEAEAVESFGQRPTLGFGITFFVTWFLLVFFNLFATVKPGNEGGNIILGLMPAVFSLISITFFILYWVKLVSTRKRIIRLGR